MSNPKQLIFPFQVNQRASFENFFCSSDNRFLLTRLSDFVSSNDAQELIISGEKDVGKSFLIQAICNELGLRDRKFAFIPMNKAINMDIGIFQDLASLDVICIDDLQLILANEDWEKALFNLINDFLKT